MPPQMPPQMQPQMQPFAGTVPNPDPTVRTVEQLQREIAASREILETRLSGMDKAIDLLQVATNKIPDNIRSEVRNLQALHEEKFKSIAEVIDTRFDGIETQFVERDKRTEQLSLADKTAIAAALQAQKEAAGAQNESNTTANNKMEATFAKLIDQTQTLLQAVTNNTDGKINDLKSRLDKGEGRDVGGAANQIAQDRSGSHNVALAAVAISALASLLAAGGLIVAIIK